MRTILLDTHVALWLFVDSPKLPAAIRAAAGDTAIRWVFHQVSSWEIQIKFDLGKLPLPEAPETFLPALIRDSGLSYERIDDHAIFLLSKLPNHHRDPFDRLLIAHAAVNGWEIATVDKQIMKYPVRMFAPPP